ncbi:MAG TPA: hypothetical protein PKE42_09535 [Arachnia sp.]|jgi:hypothetical protein|nr:hypothetical protein [Arachnia sp.]
MRTTLTLDDDVARLISETARSQRRSTKDVVNAALRSALAPKTVKPYRVPVHRSDLLPGVDAARLNQLADEAGDDELVDSLRLR